MKLVKEFFSENSEISIMRIMSVLSLIIGAGLAIGGYEYNIVAIFVYSAFAGKAVQRYAEISEAPKPKK